MEESTLIDESAFQSLYDCQSGLWILFQHATQQLYFSEPCVYLIVEDHSPAPVALQYFSVIFAREERSSVEKLVANCSKTENIALNSEPSIGQIFNLKYFGSHVAWSAASHEDVLFFVNFSGQPKVYYLNLQIFSNDYVVRLEVPVHNAQVFEISQAAEERGQYLPSLFGCYHSILFHECFEGNSFDVVHNKIQGIFCFVNSLQSGNMLTFHRPHHADLIFYCSPPFAFVGFFLRENLYRNFFSFPDVLSQIDGGKAALAQFPKRLEVGMEALVCDAAQQRILPLRCPWPEISPQLDSPALHEEPDSLSPFSQVDELKLETGPDGDIDGLVPRDEPEMAAVKFQLTDGLLQHKTLTDNALLIASLLQWPFLLAIHIKQTVLTITLSLQVQIIKMENNLLEDVLTVLVDVKVELQKLKSRVYQDLVKKIDGCISKVAPLIDVYMGNSFKLQRPIQSMRDKTLSHKEISTFDRRFQIKEINYQLQQEQLLKVRKSFIKQDDDELDSSVGPKRDIIIDYFMFKYDFKLKQYIILGRQGGEKSDRRVFLDLFTEEKKKGDLKKLEKTESMTSILKAIYTPDKIGEPFVLPNCQQQQIKYLFVFGLQQCGCYEKDFFRTETLYCFVTREFILGGLTNLMDSIAKICFEQRVSEISPNDTHNFIEIMENLNAKKTFHAIEEGVEEFLRNFEGYDSSPNLTVSKMERWKSNTMEHYLERSSLRWTLMKKGKVKEQKCFQTLVLLFYFAISQYKIIIISQNHNKHIISELIVGLLSALDPLTFVYPIVTATITPHHMEFTNSPVPLLLGLWGCQEYHGIAKSSLKKLLKQQKDLSRSEMQRQTLMVFFDIQEHTIGFLQSSFKEIFPLVQKMQNHIQAKYQGPISQKLSYLLSQLLQQSTHNSQQWMSQLRKKLRETQMYEFITSKQG